MMMTPLTTIFLTNIDIRDFPTKSKLVKLAKSDKESFDSVICRLLQEREGAKRIEVNSHGFAFLGRGNKGRKVIVIGMED